jgi:hypothetical protein
MRAFLARLLMRIYGLEKDDPFVRARTGSRIAC